jgi:hypothetical protein
MVATVQAAILEAQAGAFSVAGRKRVSTDARRRRTRTHVLLRILWAAAAAAAAAAGCTALQSVQ